MKDKVGIIGHFGANENKYDGQTVKTKNLAMLLESAVDMTIIKADTYYFRKNPIKLLLDTLRCVFTCDHVFLLVAENGMKFYLPFLYYLNKVAHCKIYHYVIGSELLELVKNNHRLVKYLNALDANWFEYESGTRYLRSQGVSNAFTLSNFKMLEPVEKAVPYDSEEGIFRFCTFSRVMEEKGITDAIEAISRINAANGNIVATLDIYGPIEAGYADKLEQLLLENRDCASYKGTVNSQKSVDILKDYYALLFPTKWPGEGVPGTIIDSFAAGLPIIASDWNANRELIENKKQGILYPNDEIQTLENAVHWAILHKDELAHMRTQSRETFTAYMPETILKVIFEKMKGNTVQ